MSDKYVLVTGSGRGIGKETALYLAQNGYKPVLHYNKTKPDYMNARTLQFDITDRKQCRDVISKDIEESVFRLHVIANSDSYEDQNLKYKVRDNLLEYMNALCIDVESKEEAIKIANLHLEEFKKIAEETIKENGFSYPAYV